MISKHFIFFLNTKYQANQCKSMTNIQTHITETCLNKRQAPDYNVSDHGQTF